MSIKSLNPYLNFDGRAAEAIAHYERALGAKTGMVMRFGEVQGMPVAPENRDRVMHATLTMGGGTIMVSDGPPGAPVAAGDTTQVALHFADDLADMDRKFTALAEGGQVTMPLTDTFWGARFGTLVDRFGIRWMFNGELPKQG
jgi:PhnB protein